MCDAPSDVPTSPQVVAKLILVAPNVTKSKAQRLSMPTFLAWAKDDAINPYGYARTFQENSPQLTMHSEEQGGHAVLPSYAELITRWLEKP